MKSEEHQKEFGCRVAEYNFRPLQVLCQWKEEIQAPIVLRETKKIYVTVPFWLVFESSFQVWSPGGFHYSEGRLNGGFIRYEFGERIFGEACTWTGLFSDFYGRYYHSKFLSKKYSPTYAIAFSTLFSCYVWYAIKHCVSCLADDPLTLNWTENYNTESIDFYVISKLITCVKGS